MIKNLMIPSDGSHHSQKAVEFGIEFASKIGADIIAVYVLDESATYTYDCLEDEGNEILHNITKKAGEKGVKVVEHLITGDPLRDMKAIAIKTNADGIIINAHGRDESDRGIIGNVADRVIKTFEIPVVLLKNDF
ncbi:MAG: universal stress protein [Methanobrevibacter sp.]|jgi:nucleotide-binding universal stress UspA family protein|nr:universal stress protein [Candidatus Methanovirga aequatorialis]